MLYTKIIMSIKIHTLIFILVTFQFGLAYKLSAEGPWNDKACAYTFSSDDGNDDNMDWKPIFDSFGYHFTVFVSPAFIGNSGKLTISDLNVLHETGCEIASHSMTHRHLIRNTAFTIRYIGNADSCKMKIADDTLYLNSSNDTEDYTLALTDSIYVYLIDIVNYINALPTYDCTLYYYPERHWSCESKYLVETDWVGIKNESYQALTENGSTMEQLLYHSAPLDKATFFLQIGV